MKRKLIILILISIPIIFFDQLLKYIVNERIPIYRNIPVIRHFFNIVHVNNRGVAFGLLNNYSNILIIAFTSLVILLLIYGLFRIKIVSGLFSVSMSLVISGAFSNLVNRIFSGYVVDFLDFHIKGYHWPSFNLADSSVVIGTILIFISIIKYI